MNEVAWCYLEGFGTKKDKVSFRNPPVALHMCTCILQRTTPESSLSGIGSIGEPAAQSCEFTSVLWPVVRRVRNPDRWASTGSMEKQDAVTGGPH